MRVVGVSGNITRPSRTRLVVGQLAAACAQRGAEVACFDVVDAGPALGTATARSGAGPGLERIWSAIEGCNALIVGSPVYKASYSGMFKHLFDLLDKDALRGRPVLLAATGRLRQYGSMIDDHLRPLFDFFQCDVLPAGLYACDEDFTAAGALTPAVEAGLPALAGHLMARAKPGRGASSAVGAQAAPGPTAAPARQASA